MKKMQIDIIAVVPELLDSPFGHSIVKRAKEKGKVDINIVSLREYGIGAYKKIDDESYGGGAGMVLMCEPLAKCIEDLKSKTCYDEIIYLSPDGNKYDQKEANRLSMASALLLICGHYKGIDERIREKYISCEISIGDYVLTGGELASIVMVDSIVRLLPGVLNDETSALTDTFQDGLVAPPVYTRPASFEGMEVPEVLRSGNVKKINEWQEEMSLKRTKEKRPDLLK